MKKKYKIISIDYGIKKTGIAITKSNNLISIPFLTIKTNKIINFLKIYLKKECVKLFIIGISKKLNNKESEFELLIKKFYFLLKKKFPLGIFFKENERYTSKLSSQILSKKNKNKIDSISATLILQSFLIKNFKKNDISNTRLF